MALKDSTTNCSKLDLFDVSMLNKLPSLSRKRRKREASKKRRAILRKEMGKLI